MAVLISEPSREGSGIGSSDCDDWGLWENSVQLVGLKISYEVCKVFQGLLVTEILQVFGRVRFFVLSKRLRLSVESVLESDNNAGKFLGSLNRELPRRWNTLAS